MRNPHRVEPHQGSAPSARTTVSKGAGSTNRSSTSSSCWRDTCAGRELAIVGERGLW